ncbi:hypothetical protein B566_EDAN006835 [Ephemera danica]|nr:hypothetical protein B566_EDAN006835 [Ephemera danica]
MMESHASSEVGPKLSAWKTLSNVKHSAFIDEQLKKLRGSGKPKKIVIVQHEVIGNIQQDCKTFLAKFIAQGEINFAAFSKLWRDIGFTFIFCGESEYQYTNEYVEEVFGVAKALWLPPKQILQRQFDVCQIPHDPVPSMEERLAAFYMVYALFKVQPSYKSISSIGHVQFTILESDMKYLAEFVGTIRERQLQELQAMFCTLITEEAFKFCATFYENPRKHLPYCETLELQTHENEIQGLTKNTVQRLSQLFCSVTEVSSEYVRRKLRSPEGCDVEQEMEMLSSFVNILSNLYPKGAEYVSNVPRDCNTSLVSPTCAETALDPVIPEEIQQTQNCSIENSEEIVEKTRNSVRLSRKKSAVAVNNTVNVEAPFHVAIKKMKQKGAPETELERRSGYCDSRFVLGYDFRRPSAAAATPCRLPDVNCERLPKLADSTHMFYPNRIDPTFRDFEPYLQLFAALVNNPESLGELTLMIGGCHVPLKSLHEIVDTKCTTIGQLEACVLPLDVFEDIQKPCWNWTFTGIDEPFGRLCFRKVDPTAYMLKSQEKCNKDHIDHKMDPQMTIKVLSTGEYLLPAPGQSVETVRVPIILPFKKRARKETPPVSPEMQPDSTSEMESMKNKMLEDVALMKFPDVPTRKSVLARWGLGPPTDILAKSAAIVAKSFATKQANDEENLQFIRDSVLMGLEQNIWPWQLDENGSSRMQSTQPPSKCLKLAAHNEAEAVSTYSPNQQVMQVVRADYLADVTPVYTTNGAILVPHTTDDVR